MLMLRCIANRKIGATFLGLAEKNAIKDLFFFNILEIANKSLNV